MPNIKKETVKIWIWEILHYEKNNKIHTEKDITEIAKSIKKNWYLSPILIDEDNILLAGHWRTLALWKLWYEQIEVVKISGLSEKQKKDFRIRDNTTSLLAEFDLDNLKLELESLWDFSSDIFEHLDFDLWMNFWNESETFREDIQDEIPEVSEKTYIKEGDFFKLWNHFLFCWSSILKENITKLLWNLKADMVLTDPPYLMNFEGSIWWDWQKSNRHNHKKIENDNLKWEEWQKFLEDFSEIVKEFCSGSYYIFFYRLWIDKIFRALDKVWLKWKNLIIWKKNHFNLSPSDYKSIYEPIVNGWADDYEPIFYWWNGEHNFYWKKWESDVIDDILVSSVLESQKTLKNDLHPTMKPIALLEKILNNSSKPWDKVLDLFWGSGSTLIACQKLKRNCYMAELSPEYVQVIIKRFYEVTAWEIEIECLNRKINFSFLD